jgi:hypothetical protein
MIKVQKYVQGLANTIFRTLSASSKLVVWCTNGQHVKYVSLRWKQLKLGQIQYLYE